MEVKLAKHCAEWEKYLARAKKDFEKRWTNPFEPNGSLDDFIIVRTLGTGAFGRVMLVKDRLNPSRVYAMKAIEKEHIVKSKQIEHMHSEIRIIDAIKFDFLIGMEYFFKNNVYLFLLMPFVNGGEMFTHLRNMKKFDENLSKFYAAQVVLSLEYLHYLGIVYRDLKPENILIDKDGFLRITDYGFCKRIRDNRTYTLCGTPEYLAPEVILSQGYGMSVDWWSFGILIYEMSAGFPPFNAKEPMRLYEKIVGGKYLAPSHFTKALKDLIYCLLQTDKTKRYGVLKNGTKDIKSHDWFKSLDWDAVLTKKAKAPFRPKVKSFDDASQFEKLREINFRETLTNEYDNEFEVINVIEK